MRIAEIGRDYLKKEYGGNRAAALAAGDFILFDDDRIRRAFNAGAGTAADMRRWMKDNAAYCIFYDLDARAYI